MAKDSRRQPRQARAAPRPSASLPAGRGKGQDFAVIGMGASAGGLEACKLFLDALAPGAGLAIILIVHLDPDHESMMVELLARHTTMAVVQAADGMLVEPEHLYVIPPGTYLSIRHGALHLSPPQAPHGARLPFDFLLQSLAEECGPRGICVVLSGTGADGSLGLKSVKEAGGLVIAQDPAEASHDGMPRSAILTGAVDMVLPIARIPEALLGYARQLPFMRALGDAKPPQSAPDLLAEIISLLRTSTPHDFRLYKQGTMLRRIERRMAIAAIPAHDLAAYIGILRNDSDELELLAKDLLINVTRFFRDPDVFTLLAETAIPELVRNCAPGLPIRVWIAGCSTGEETYSIAMLLREEIAASGRNIRLQLFASDVDPDAVAAAREGLYPASIEADVSPERLGRFFTKEDGGYRILPDLRGAVVFTVQDVLADPPFSRLDLVSCRNLLIYLLPQAQSKILSIFHFALRKDGFLLLGSAESIGEAETKFEPVAKSARLYRHVTQYQLGEPAFFSGSTERGRGHLLPGREATSAQKSALAELCQRLIMDGYAPAAILVNRRHQCVYSVGPTDRYLRVAPGHPTLDLFAMVRPGLHNTLGMAIDQASESEARVVVPAGRTVRDGQEVPLSIAVQPVSGEGEALLLVCFIEGALAVPGPLEAGSEGETQSASEMQRELDATRAELRAANASLDRLREEQKAINEVASSVNEEFQSTNEELLTSKEELQSLNEELTALNNQLHETLDRQRITANDLQNVLFSTDVATLFLDTHLNIRLFTPAIKSFFRMIPGDVGRPLADLSSLSSDATLLADAGKVLEHLVPIERQIEGRNGAWHMRRILPYRTQDGSVEGVVIVFNDITARRQADQALATARREAEVANLAKSRFLAAASHDLRQPLQTLTLLHGLVARAGSTQDPKKLVARLDETVATMSSMLNALLDITQIEAGGLVPQSTSFPIGDLLERLEADFVYQANAKGLELRVVRSSLLVRSDPYLLEQMLRNLLSNALKYTTHGKVLLGCRRRNGSVGIQVWDTGIGIQAEEFDHIFKEYHQVGSEPGERRNGLGLGLSIVRRLGDLLGHEVRVHSLHGKGSMFVVDVALHDDPSVVPAPREVRGTPDAGGAVVHRTGAILIVEDDPDVRELLDILLKGEGHVTTTAGSGTEALEFLGAGMVRPDLLLTDYNLPNGLDGVALAVKLRERLRRLIPAIVLTGDVSADMAREIALHDCVALKKPIKLTDLVQAIQRLLPEPSPAAPDAPAGTAEASAGQAAATVVIIDDDSQICDSLRTIFEQAGRTVQTFATAEAFTDSYRPGARVCLVVDAYLPGMSGFDLLQWLADSNHRVPAIIITGHGDVPTAVRAIKAGAVDFIEKPIGRGEILAAVTMALEQRQDAAADTARRAKAASQIAALTPRQREVMEMVLAGQPSKNIAADLGISQRTVENHRAAIMEKTGTRSLPALARLAVATDPRTK